MASRYDLDNLKASPFVQSAELFVSLASTNDHAKQLDVPGTELPRLIVAETQTAGRGQGDNSWWSDGKSLTFSLLLELAEGLFIEEGSLSRKDLPTLSITTALALCDAIEQVSGLQPRIKWPNDLFLANKKCAGILLESPCPNRVVVGIGVNTGGTPDDEATSLSDIAGESIDSEAVLLAFLDCFARRLKQLCKKVPRLADDWNERSYITGRKLTIAQGEKQQTGLCIGLGNRGELLLQIEGDEVIAFVTGSVVEMS